MVHTHLWWLLYTAVTAGIREILGWVARLWSSYNVTAEDPYLMQYIYPLTFSSLLLNTTLTELSPRSLHPRLSSRLISSFSESSSAD